MLFIAHNENILALANAELVDSLFSGAEETDEEEDKGEDEEEQRNTGDSFQLESMDGLYSIGSQEASNALHQCITPLLTHCS